MCLSRYWVLRRFIKCRVVYLGNWANEAVIAKFLGSKAFNFVDVLLMFADYLMYGFHVYFSRLWSRRQG